MKKYKGLLCICLIVSMLILPGCSSTKGNSNNRDKLWVKDIETLQEKLPERHGHLFNNITEADFNAQMEKLKKDIPNINDDEIQIRLMEILTPVNDSHLYLMNFYGQVMKNYSQEAFYTVSLSATMKEMLPIKTQWFGEDLIVIEADSEYKELLGAKVNTIAGMSTADAMGKVDTLISHTNIWRLKYLNVMMLCHPQVLRHFNLLKDNKLPMEFTSKEGKAIAQEIKIKKAEDVSFAGVMDSLSEKPLYMSSDELYWYSYLPEKKAAYLRLRTYGSKYVEDMKDLNNTNASKNDTSKNDGNKDAFEGFEEFLNNMIEDMKAKNPEKIIIDIRGNNGGYSSILTPLRNYIRDNSSIPKQGSVFLLVDKGCLSGSVYEGFHYKEIIKATIIGEPTGEGPFVESANSASITLLNTRTSLQFATSEFKNKQEGVDTLTPDILVETTFEDYEKGVDPVLNAALDYK